MGADYGLLGGLAEGLKQGLLTYNTMNNIKQQRQMEGAMNGLEQDADGNWVPNAAKQAQMNLQQKETSRKLGLLSAGSPESKEVTEGLKGYLKATNPSADTSYLDNMSGQAAEEQQKLYAPVATQFVKNVGTAQVADKNNQTKETIAEKGNQTKQQIAASGNQTKQQIATAGNQTKTQVAQIGAQEKHYAADQGLVGKKMALDATQNRQDSRETVQANRMANNDPILKMYLPRLDGATKILDLIHSAQAHPEDIKSNQALLGQLNAEIARLETGSQSPGLGQAEKTEMNDAAAKWHNVLDTLTGDVTGVDLSQKYKQADAMVNELASSIRKNVNDRMSFLKSGGTPAMQKAFDQKGQTLNSTYQDRFTAPGQGLTSDTAAKLKRLQELKAKAGIP